MKLTSASSSILQAVFSLQWTSFAKTRLVINSISSILQLNTLYVLLIQYQITDWLGESDLIAKQCRSWLTANRSRWNSLGGRLLHITAFKSGRLFQIFQLHSNWGKYSRCWVSTINVNWVPGSELTDDRAIADKFLSKDLKRMSSEANAGFISFTAKPLCVFSLFNFVDFLKLQKFAK